MTKPLCTHPSLMVLCPLVSYQVASVLSWLHVVIIPMNLKYPSLLIRPAP